MSKLFGMPLAIILCFALGLILSLLPNLPVALAAFFLAVGLTCLTYSYLGGHLDRGGNEGKGTLGVLSFKLGGSIVTFLVSWLFLNHHLSLSDAEENRRLTLKSGRDTIQVQANARPLGLLEGEEVRDWVQDLAEVDYFHPALILARRPFCSDNPGKCVLYAGFRAAAIKADNIDKGTMKLCVIGPSTRDVEESLQDNSLQPLLNAVQVVAADSRAESAPPLNLKSRYVQAGSSRDLCRNITPPRDVDSLPAIRIGALMNADDLRALQSKTLPSARQATEVKVLFQSSD